MIARFLPAGESSLTVEFGDTIDPVINARVVSLSKNLSKKPIRGVRECAGSYRSLLVMYDPLLIRQRKLIRRLRKRIRNLPELTTSSTRTITIPVCYGGEYGPDLPDVAAHTGLSEIEVIRRHTEPEYRVYMIGFLPGFPYLGGLDPILETPRLATPRTEIPPGAVGIGGKQTGIYPLVSPGGWRLIGRTPLRPYDPNWEPPVLFAPGDVLRFESISPEEYKVRHGI